MRIFIFFSIVFFNLYSFPQENKIIAIVGKQVITKRDLENYLKIISLRKMKESNHLDRKKALEELIETKLLLEEAKRRDYKVRDEWIEEEIKKIKREFKDEKTFAEFLKFQGISLGELKENIKNQILIEILIDEEIRSKIKVYPWQITEFYKKNIKKFTKNRVKIWIKKLSSKEIQEVFNKDMDLNLNDFQDLGWQRLDSLEEKVKELVLSSPEKKFIGPFKLNDDFYVIYLEKKEINLVEPLERVKEKIYKELLKEQFENKLQDFLKELKKRIYVKIF